MCITEGDVDNERGTTMAYIKQLASTCIKEAEYDPKTEEMTLTFANGRIYRYYDVPEAVYNGLVTAPSTGHEFNTNIRDNYTSTREA